MPVAVVLPTSALRKSCTASMVGTVLARRVLEAMSYTVYRRWTARIVTAIAAYYVAYGAFLLATA